MVEIGLFRVQLNGNCKIFNRLFKIVFPVKRDTSVVVGKGVRRINIQRLGIVADSHVKLSQFIIGKPPIEVSLKMIRLHFYSFCIQLYGFFEVSFFAGFKSLHMQLLG